MKKKHNEGFTLIELLVAMAILAAIVLPTCNSMALGFQLNAKADKMMQARLAVSSAVETLMATGITNDFLDFLKTSGDQGGTQGSADPNFETFKGLRFVLQDCGDYYDITVTDAEGLVEVKTSIRDKTTPTSGTEEEPDEET